MKKHLPLFLLLLLVLSACSLGSLSGNKGISSGLPCEIAGEFSENKGIEYKCWETGDGKLVWRQNSEVEQELERLSHESELNAEALEHKKREYYECLERNIRMTYAKSGMTENQLRSLVTDNKTLAIENRWPDSGTCKFRIGKLTS